MKPFENIAGKEENAGNQSGSQGIELLLLLLRQIAASYKTIVKYFSTIF